MNAVFSDLIYLLRCAVNGIKPDRTRVEGMDIEALYQAAKNHTVRAAVCISLERIGVQHASFHDAYKKAVRKNIYLDMARAEILAEFEQHGIWYLPLKGAILKDIYPENGMREMSDNDILYDTSKQQIVTEIMLRKGYTAESIDDGHHDVFMKQPVLNFEMHTALFGEGHSEIFNAYYANTQRLLIKDEDNQYGYHFSDEDFYIFMTAHEYKHFSNGGTGIRSLLDCYVFCKEKWEMLDQDYISEQLQQLQIADFELERRQLSMKIFSSDTLPELTEREHEMLMYYLKSGTYGTLENALKKQLKHQTKVSYVLHNLFPSLDYMKRSVRFVKKYPVLYPVGIVYRWGRVLMSRRNYLSVLLKTLKTHNTKKK